MQKTTRISSRAVPALIALLLFGCAVYFFPRWADPNQNSRLDMIVAVVDDGTLSIDKYVGNTVDYARVNGHTFSDKPPGSALLGIPLYAALKLALNAPLMDQLVARLAESPAFQATLKADGTGITSDKVRFALAQVVLTALIPGLCAVALGLMLYGYLLGLGLSAGWSAAVALVFGLATPAFAYAGAYYSHMISAAGLFGAFLLARTPAARPARLALCGFLLGLAVICEYSVVPMAGALFVFAGYRLWRDGAWIKLAWVALPAGLVGLGLMAYNNTVYGGPFKLGYEFSELWATQHQTGFMSLSLPTWEAMWGITFSPFRGLFVLSPVLLLGLPGLAAWWKSGALRAEWWASAAILVGMFIFNTSSVMWWGGFAVGPRYILPALPFLALGLGWAAKAWGRRGWFAAAFGGLALVSLLATWGLTLAGQAFPSDALHNPLLEYALPAWQSGNIARNLGTLLGLKGAASLVPLAVFELAVLAGLRLALPGPASVARPYARQEREVAHGH